MCEPGESGSKYPERLQAENDQRENGSGEQADEANNFKGNAQADGQMAKDAWKNGA